MTDKDPQTQDAADVNIPAPDPAPGPHVYSGPRPFVFRKLLVLPYVPRWVTVAVTRPQTVAEHSFRVAAIVHELCRLLVSRFVVLLPVLNRAEVNHLIWRALLHDMEEALTGDIPGPFKQRLEPELADGAMMRLADVYPGDAGSFHSRILKLANILEGLAYIRHFGVGADIVSTIEDQMRAKGAPILQGIVGQIALLSSVPVDTEHPEYIKINNQVYDVAVQVSKELLLYGAGGGGLIDLEYEQVLRDNRPCPVHPRGCPKTSSPFTSLIADILGVELPPEHRY